MVNQNKAVFVAMAIAVVLAFATVATLVTAAPPQPAAKQPTHVSCYQWAPPQQCYVLPGTCTQSGMCVCECYNN